VWPKNRAMMLLRLKLAIAGSIPLAFVLAQAYPAWVIRATIATVVIVASIIINCWEGDVFNNGFSTGLLIGVFQTLIMLYFWDKFSANLFSSHSSHFFSEYSVAQSKMMLLVVGLSVAVIYGILIGLISWSYYRILGLYIHTTPKEANSD
jgi:hypothetical protein